MEKQKLKLDDLKVQSFVTSFDKEHDQTRDVHGGSSSYHFCTNDLKPRDLPVWTITTAH